jgi:hypothetical protein
MSARDKVHEELYGYINADQEEFQRGGLDSATPQEWDKASHRQVGGVHYKEYAVEPIEFVVRNRLGFCEANAIKYICRHAVKGGVQDIDKAIHYLELLKEFKYDN